MDLMMNLSFSEDYYPRGSLIIVRNQNNMLNRYTKKKTIYLRDSNILLLETDLKVEEVNMFSFDIVIRNRPIQLQFIEFLDYLAECKENDMKKYEKALETNPDVPKIFYVAENYLNISSIKSVSLRADAKIYHRLLTLSPSIFEIPFNFSIGKYYIP